MPLIVESGTFQCIHTTKTGAIYEYHAFYRLTRTGRMDWSAMVRRFGSGKQHLCGSISSAPSAEAHRLARHVLLAEIDVLASAK